MMGEVESDGTAHYDSDRGVIPQARALWSFSMSYSQTGNVSYLEAAKKIYQWLNRYFWDHKLGGFFWSVSAKGEVLCADKKLIAQAYALFGMAAYSEASSDSDVSHRITDLLTIVDRYFRSDSLPYPTVLNRTMEENSEVSGIIEVCPHLHWLEALLELARCQPNPSYREDIRQLVQWFLERVFPVQDSMTLEFTTEWEIHGNERSYGHNFESAWLVYDAAQWLNDPELTAQAKRELLRLVDYSLDYCRHPSGAVQYGISADGKRTELISWWPQTEASNAILTAYLATGAQSYLDILQEHWLMISQYWVDHKNGEWFTELDQRLRPAGKGNKVGLWRCSYHSVRACWRIAGSLQSQDDNA